MRVRLAHPSKSSHSRFEQAELLARRTRRSEPSRVEFPFLSIKSQLFAGHLKASADHPCVRTRPLHARAPGRVVVLAATHVADQLENVTVAVGVVCNQPFAKQVAHLER